MNSENTIELTGNGFVDAYNLGFEAGKTLVEQEKQHIDNRRWDEYRRANAAEKERRRNRRVHRVDDGAGMEAERGAR